MKPRCRQVEHVGVGDQLGVLTEEVLVVVVVVAEIRRHM